MSDTTTPMEPTPRAAARFRALVASAVGALLFCGGGSAGAETTQGKYVVCLSEKAYDEMSTALAKEDTAALKFLEKQGLCFFLKEGLQASVLDRDWTGGVKARIYVGDSAVVVWGPMEAFK